MKLFKWIMGVAIWVWWTAPGGLKIAKWYERNGHYRFKQGDILMLNSPASVGVGLKPVFIVKQSKMFETSGVDSYFLKKYDLDNYKTPCDIIHCKLNVELHFRKVGKLRGSWV